MLVEFDRNGSLPTTHETQGSDMGLFGGLMGWDADDERLPDSPQALREAASQIRIETVDAGDPHPNTYRLTLAAPASSTRSSPSPRRRHDRGHRRGRLQGVHVRRLL